MSRCDELGIKEIGDSKTTYMSPRGRRIFYEVIRITEEEYDLFKGKGSSVGIREKWDKYKNYNGPITAKHSYPNGEILYRSYSGSIRGVRCYCKYVPMKDKKKKQIISNGSSDKPIREFPGEPPLKTGSIQITLRWFTFDDLDLSVISPRAEKLSYETPRVNSGGFLDVDSNAGCEQVTAKPVENIVWPFNSSPPKGRYVISVNLYDYCSRSSSSGIVTFEVTIKINGSIFKKILGSVNGSKRTSNDIVFNYP